MIRTFISIPMPEEVKKEVLKIQKQLPKFEGKLTEEANLHLTLKFLGEIDEKKLEEVKEALSKIKFKRFESQFFNLGVFDKNQIRIVWIYLKDCKQLQEIVDNSLKSLFKPEVKVMCHLTIARVKSVNNKNMFLGELNKIRIPKSNFIVDKFYLMKSDLAETGPSYEVIKEYKLI
jgi:2'-5' RNA ligase